MSKIKCVGCGNQVDWNGSEEIVCPYCGDVISDVQTLFDNNLFERLGLAAGFRRVGRFEDSQQELENILISHDNLAEALFGCVLNYYEVTEYSFANDNRVQSCKCFSTDRRPVEKNADWQLAKELAHGARLTQWMSLSRKIEEQRNLNIRIKNSIPHYRAILIYDYDNERDARTAYGLYNCLCKKTDIFFPPVSLQLIPYKERESYLVQVLKSPEIAPLMFVIYSDSFNVRAKNEYYKNVARQCMDFATVHTKSELISVMCDFEPPSIMKRLSVKTIECSDFDKQSYEPIANVMLDYTLRGAYDDDEYDRHMNGEQVCLNEKGISPLIYPVN